MDKADAVYKSIVLGLAIPDGSRLPDYLAEPYVHEVFSLARAAGNEAHHLLGFLRFEKWRFNCHGAPKAQHPASVSRPFQRPAAAGKLYDL